MNSNTIGLSVLILIQIPSFFCALQLFRFGQNDNPLRHLPNHLLVCLLAVSMWTISIDLPCTEAYLWTGFVPIRTNWACIFYNISGSGFTGLNRLLMAFMCIERHFLVFRPQLYRTHRSRLLFHYIPLFITITFSSIYYIVTNAFVSCPEQHFDYSSFMCGYTCAELRPQLGTVFTWIFVFLPTAITIVASILLPIRFVIQKRTLQRLQWHRARKMIIQTSIIAGAYSLCWLSYTIILQLLIQGVLGFYNSHINSFFIYEPYTTSLLTPFIVQHTIPGWMNRKTIKQIKHRFFPRRQNLIQPRTALVT